MQSLVLGVTVARPWTDVANYYWKRLLRFELQDDALHVHAPNWFDAYIRADSFHINGERAEAHELVLQRGRGPDCWALCQRRGAKFRELLTIDYNPKGDISDCIVGRYLAELPPVIARGAGALIERAAARWALPSVELCGDDIE